MQNPYMESRVPGNFPYRDFCLFLIIRRAIVIEAKASYRNSVQGKQNFPGTREKKSLLRHTFFEILDT